MPAFKEILYPGLCRCSLCLDSLGPAGSGAWPGLHSAIGMTLASQGQTVRWQNNMGTFHKKPLLLSHPEPFTFKGHVMLLLLMICSKVWACLGLPWAAALAPSSSGHVHAILESQIIPSSYCLPPRWDHKFMSYICPPHFPFRHLLTLSSPPDYYIFCFSFWTQPILLFSLIYKYLQRSRQQDQLWTLSRHQLSLEIKDTCPTAPVKARIRASIIHCP